LRREGWIPGVVNSPQGESHLIRLNRHDFELRLQHHASENLILDLVVDDAPPKKVLLKEVQHDYVTGAVLHADFVEISMTRRMRVNVPLRLVGEPVGVTQEGGVLEHPLREIAVECLPGDLVEQIEVDVSHLTIGDSLLVRDVVVDPKLTILTAREVAVALVSAPRAEEVPVAAEAAPGAEAPQEPELIGEKGKQEPEEEAEEKPKEPAKEKAREPAKEKAKERTGERERK
jgi:large subunit ribosomal protein L25